MRLRDRVTRDRPAELAGSVRLDDLVVEPPGSVAPFLDSVDVTDGAVDERGEAVVTGRRARRRRPWALEAAALAVIVAVGGLLRFWNLDRVGFRGDEAVYAGQAAVLAGVDELQRWFILMSRGNSNFLLFQRVVSLVYRTFGVSDVLARAVAATFSTLTIVVVFAIARSLYTRRAALIAALLLAVSSYSVVLGRLALLDSTLTFLVTLAMLCLVRWDRTSKPAWLYGFGACVALAIQAKIVGVLLLPILGGYLLVVETAAAVADGGAGRGGVPGLPQPGAAGPGIELAGVRRLPVAEQPPGQPCALDLLPDSAAGSGGGRGRVLWTAGIVMAVVRRSRADLIPGLWLLVFVGFYLLYPLKAFNYLLPSVPALCLLAARVLDRLPRLSWSVPRVAVTVGLVGVLVAGVVPYQWRALHDDSYAGLEEAARWLADNSPAGAGVMTLSHGSAQYVFSFYGRRDAYPFGRFRLATVLPGGKIVHALPSTEGITPRDWVALWPPQLLEKGAVDYLVYYATSTTIDDPEEDPLVNTSTQRSSAS